MTSKPIYTPSGKAKEYGDLAINIYTGCPHRCFYCFAPGVLRKDKEEFHTHIEPKKDIVERVRRQIEREGIKDKLIHLCFTCDPYPTGYDTMPTREIIKIIKESGNHVQILTKGDGSRDFDLLDENDWYGISLDGTEKITLEDYPDKWRSLWDAVVYERFKTWISFEPVVNAEVVLRMLVLTSQEVDKIKIGKLNYHPSDIDWADFGRRAEALCQNLGINYYIKEGLRKEMDGGEK